MDTRRTRAERPDRQRCGSGHHRRQHAFDVDARFGRSVCLSRRRAARHLDGERRFHVPRRCGQRWQHRAPGNTDDLDLRVEQGRTRTQARRSEERRDHALDPSPLRRLEICNGTRNRVGNRCGYRLRSGHDRNADRLAARRRHQRAHLRPWHLGRRTGDVSGICGHARRTCGQRQDDNQTAQSRRPDAGALRQSSLQTLHVLTDAQR